MRNDVRNDASRTTEKRRYLKPRLTEYGSIKKLTLASAASGTDLGSMMLP